MYVDKVALITGGASGIGFAIGEKLLQLEIKKVVLADINTKHGKEAEADLRKRYGVAKVNFVQLDVTKPDKFEEVFKKLSLDGGIDFFFNNAGVNIIGGSIADDAKLIEINLIAPNTGIRLALKYLKRGGKIINTASVASFLGIPEMVPYCASKAGVVGLTKSFGSQKYMEEYGISVIAFCPGYTETRLTESVFSTDIIMKSGMKRDYNGQTAAELAGLIPKIIEIGQNGSVWIIEEREAYEVRIPDYKQCRI